MPAVNWLADISVGLTEMMHLIRQPTSEKSMTRPVGVVASAVVAAIGSAFTLLMAAGTLWSISLDTPQSREPGYGATAIGAAAFFTVLAAVGIWTSIALFRLRPWARTSMLVFSGIMATLCLFILVIVAIVPMPMPPQTDPSVARTIRPVLLGMFGIPLAIGVWWLIQFNTASTKAVFTRPMAGSTTSRRPLSITIIAWLAIIGGVSLIFPILTRLPAMLLGITFTGSSATIVYVFFAAVSLYIGWGLLRLEERARIVGIVWFALSLAQVILVLSVPSLRARMLEMQRAASRSDIETTPFDSASFMSVVLVLVAAVTATVIWFLVRNRPAFDVSSSQPELSEPES